MWGRAALAAVLFGIRSVASTAELAPLPASAPASTAAPATDATQESLQEIVIQAWEPRYVAPTRRDRIGRIWAPVYINGQGPFRLVLDSGANRSGITQSIADQLSLPPTNRHVMLRGVTGSAAVPTVHARSMDIGDLSLGESDLPILTDALGGADGILGTDRLMERRIFVDFRRDQITIARSHLERAPPGYLTLPFELTRNNLLAVKANVGNIRVIAIIDTGGQVTVANQALKRALERRHKALQTREDRIMGVTADVQIAEAASAPAIQLQANDRDQDILIRSDAISFGDLFIFQHWQMTNEPTVLIGMDVLGQLESLIIDYKRRELQVRMRPGT
ncbi:MAG: retropepsin-like aspartic protease [Steroidobacteraceae bacterium]